MRLGIGPAAGLLFLLAAVNARGEKLLAVLPLDLTNADGRMTRAARVSLEEMLRDVASDALGRSEWTVLTNENQLQLLIDNGIDPSKCGDQQCHLAAARELKTDLFISGAVQWFDDEFTASIRLLSSRNGRIVASERLSGTTAKQLRTEFEGKATAFFQKAELLARATPIPVVVARPAAPELPENVIILKRTASHGTDSASAARPPVVTEQVAATQITRSPVVADVTPAQAPFPTRARGVLLTEIQTLERRFADIPWDTPDRLNIARQLADSYVELEKGMQREKVRLEGERNALQPSDPLRARERGREVEKARTVAEGARSQADRYYRYLSWAKPR